MELSSPHEDIRDTEIQGQRILILHMQLSLKLRKTERRRKGYHYALISLHDSPQRLQKDTKHNTSAHAFDLQTIEHST